MNAHEAQVQSDRELTSIAMGIFVEQGFAVEEVEFEGGSIVLAENAYFVVGLVATPTIAQLLMCEGIAESMIAGRLASSDVGPKRWDAYLVLLTQERSPETFQVTRGLFEINYDTSRLRRLAHAGVDPTKSAIRSALSPFLPPEDLEIPVISENPLKNMADEMAARGVERQLALRAIEAFEQGVPLGNVL